VEIRKATAADDEAIAELFAGYAEAHAADLGNQDVVDEGRHARRKYAGGALMVAEDQGTILGVVAYEPWGAARARMKRMYVPPANRGQGIGRKLADAILLRAARDGHTEMVLDTSGPMIAATALYEGMGFAEFKPDYEAPGADVVYLQRSLLDL
jgi:putative acetyltransferase